MAGSSQARNPDDQARSQDDALAGLDLGCLIGPTATGKSRLALGIAARAGAEIISLDSMQVYRGMDVGTAKPSADDRARVRHHMLDLVPPSERYDAHRWLEDLRPVLLDLRARGRRGLFVGGTGFYLKALLSGLFAGPAADLELRGRIEARAVERGNAELHRELTRLDPRSAARIHAHDTRRLVRALEVYEQTGRPLSEWQREWGWHESRGAPFASDVRLVGLDVRGEDLTRRIARRTRAMLDRGWIEEAVRVRAATGFGPTAIQALGYRDVLELADGRLELEECAARISLRTRQFARRQRTWYRKISVRWLEGFPAASGDACADEPVERDLLEAAVRALGWDVG